MRGDDGSVLIESALGIGLVLSVALAFASLVSYATYAARDLAAVQTAIRDAARSGTIPAGGDIDYRCGATVTSLDAACGSTAGRGTYIAALKDTVVPLPFGLTLRTAAKAVARVG